MKGETFFAGLVAASAATVILHVGLALDTPTERLAMEGRFTAPTPSSHSRVLPLQAGNGTLDAAFAGCARSAVRKIMPNAILIERQRMDLAVSPGVPYGWVAELLRQRSDEGLRFVDLIVEVPPS